MNSIDFFSQICSNYTFLSFTFSEKYKSSSFLAFFGVKKKNWTESIKYKNLKFSASYEIQVVITGFF
jgi:hypothetical protein